MAVAVLGAAGSARAQLGASLTLQSDEQFRGHSLSGRRPAAAFNLSYDAAGGAYAGASLSVADGTAPGLVEDIGYVRRLSGDLALDLGASDAQVTDYKFPHRREAYQELYAGLIGDRLSFHGHYSPDYFHSGIQTLYADLDGAIRIADAWRLVEHLGVLTPLAGPIRPGSRKERYDVGAGVTRRLAHVELSLSWHAISPIPNMPGGRPQDRNGLVLSASYDF